MASVVASAFSRRRELFSIVCCCEVGYSILFISLGLGVSCTIVVGLVQRCSA